MSDNFYKETQRIYIFLITVLCSISSDKWLFFVCLLFGFDLGLNFRWSKVYDSTIKLNKPRTVLLILHYSQSWENKSIWFLLIPCFSHWKFCNIFLESLSFHRSIFKYLFEVVVNIWGIWVVTVHKGYLEWCSFCSFFPVLH